MKKSAIVGGSSILLSAIPKIKGIHFSDEDFDVIIKKGVIVDGTGSERYSSDLGIRNGIIREIGNLSQASAKSVIEAENFIVSPGFIDIHTHTDLGILTNPRGESKIHQGITTEVGGQCGGSFAPINQNDFIRNAELYKEKYDLNLKSPSFGAHLEMMRDWNFSVNQANMVGLGTIRELIVGMDDRPASKNEMEEMKREIINAINNGAVGISSGLEYTPGSFADTEELIELARSMPEGISKLYATHMRNEDNTVEEAVAEAIKIARESGSRLELSHLKASGKSNWHKADSLLDMLDKAVADGMDAHADRYTYVAYHTGLANLFPLWARDGGKSDFINRLKDNSNYEELKKYSEKKVANLDGGWNGVVISGIKNEDFSDFKGKSVQQISDEIGLTTFDTSIKLLAESDAKVSMVGFGMSEESTEKILSHPRVMIASDASAHAPYPPMNKSIAHPRAYGTFPRAIAKYVKERKLVSLEEMIRKMTLMPAQKIGIKDRGEIAVGKQADITIINYDQIKDTATFINSSQYPEGIPYVLVNGVAVIEKGKHTGALPGNVITV
ncbi:MAG: D-aminoacylase [Bacteroidota bacterium]